MLSKVSLRCASKMKDVNERLLPGLCYAILSNRVYANLSYTDSQPMSESRARSVTSFYNQSAIDIAAMKVMPIINNLSTFKI